MTRMSPNNFYFIEGAFAPGDQIARLGGVGNSKVAAATRGTATPARRQHQPQGSGNRTDPDRQVKIR